MSIMEIIKQSGRSNMNANKPARLVKTTLLLLCGAALAVSSAQATLVTWDFNPTNANASLGAASQTFTASGYSITAYGYDDVSGPDTPHTLYYKDAPGSPSA